MSPHWNCTERLAEATTSSEGPLLGTSTQGLGNAIGRWSDLTPFLSGRGVSSALKSLQDRLIACVDS